MTAGSFGVSLSFIIFVAAFLPRAAFAWDKPKERTVSSSQQFIVYCDNAIARGEIASFAESTKRKLLALLGARDNWKAPIVINIAQPDTARPMPFASHVSLFEVEHSFKVQLDVSLAAKDASDVRFQQQLVRALLLEFAYRDKPSLVKGGIAYVEPPTWLVEGAAALFQSRADDANAMNNEMFKTMFNNGKLPPLTEFLAMDESKLDTASARSIYAGCSMCLLQLLTDMPDGRSSLAALVKNWPSANGDSFGEFIKRFPMLGADSASLEKWWTLGLAHLAAADRFQGLTLEQTEQRLAPLLSFEITAGRGGEKKMFSLDQFEEFRKIPASQTALNAMSANLMAFGAEANTLFRPVIFEYQKIAADLAHGKTRGVRGRLIMLAEYRDELLHRMDEIADFMNWFEATQPTKKSGSFDDYIKAANTFLNQKPKRDDRISRYLDEVEQQISN